MVEPPPSATPVPHRVFLPVDFDAPPPARPAPDARAHRFTGASMGTTWSVQAWAPPAVPAAQLHAAVEAELQRTVDLFSHWHAHSEVARFNAAPASAWQFSAGAWPVIAHSLTLAQATDGAVDPTLGALIDLWGFGPPGLRQPPQAPVPNDAEIAAALACAGWQRVRAEAATRTLHKPAGLRLDLGGIAKGWAVDQVSTRLLREGAAVHLVEIGGELKARGLKPDLRPWWVELEEADAGPASGATAPAAPAAPAARVPSAPCAPPTPPALPAPPRQLLALVDAALATSGDWRRHITHEGRRLAHTLDGRTGRPCDNGIAGVTVLHPQALQADALATAFTVMGTDQALAWATAHGVAVRLTVRGAQGLVEHLSPAMAAMLCADEP